MLHRAVPELSNSFLAFFAFAADSTSPIETARAFANTPGTLSDWRRSPPEPAWRRSHRAATFAIDLLPGCRSHHGRARCANVSAACLAFAARSGCLGPIGGVSAWWIGIALVVLRAGSDIPDHLGLNGDHVLHQFMNVGCGRLAEEGGKRTAGIRQPRRRSAETISCSPRRATGVCGAV